jgi:hypothetical protein
MLQRLEQIIFCGGIRMSHVNQGPKEMIASGPRGMCARKTFGGRRSGGAANPTGTPAELTLYE